MAFFIPAPAPVSKLYQLGCESLCFFLSDRRKQVGVDVFLWITSEDYTVMSNYHLRDMLQRIREHKRRPPKHMNEPFAGLVYKNTAQLRKEMTATQRELDKMVKRNLDFSALFKRLYEDNVLGRISNEQFRMLSADYNAEQKQLAAAIPEKQAKLEKLKASAANVDAFIEKTSRYTEITELMPELLWTFIERIDIGERPGRYNRNGMQEVRIIYRGVGVVDSTLSAEDAESTEVHFIPSLEMVVQQMTAQTQVS